jgi:tetratricopeptide (TPR) repeat protein
MPDLGELLFEARRAVVRGEHRKALPLLEEAAKMRPDLFGTHLLLGVCLTSIGRHARGAAALRQAIELNPRSARGHYNLGVALKALGRLAEAETHFTNAVQLDPSYEVAAAALRDQQQRRRPSDRLKGRAPKIRRLRPPSPWMDLVLSAAGARRARPQDRVPLRRAAKWAAVAAVGLLTAVSVGGRPTHGSQGAGIAWWNPSDTQQIAFSPDGEVLAAAGSGIDLWSAADGELLRSLGDPGEQVVDLAFSPDGALLAASCRDEEVGVAVRMWRVADGSLAGELPAGAGQRPLAFSPDGKLLAVGTDYLSAARPLGVQLWKMPEMQLLRTLAVPQAATGYVSAITFSPDGKLIASADDVGLVQLSRTQDARLLSSLDTGHLFVVSLAFSPDGALLAHAGMSGPRVAVCAVPSGAEVACLDGEQSARGRIGRQPAVNDLDFSPDGDLLAASESTGDLARVEVFSVSEGRLLRTLDAAPAGGGRAPRTGRSLADVRAVEFSPDGKHLAWCGSNGVIVSRVAELVG